MDKDISDLEKSYHASPGSIVEERKLLHSFKMQYVFVYLLSVIILSCIVGVGYALYESIANDKPYPDTIVNNMMQIVITSVTSIFAFIAGRRSKSGGDDF